MRYLLPKLYKRLTHAATLGKAKHLRQSSRTPGKHGRLMQQSLRIFPAAAQLQNTCCTTPAAQYLLCSQAAQRSSLTPTSADWLRTCNRNGTTRPTPLLGSIIIAPQSSRKAWWISGMCKTGRQTQVASANCSLHKGRWMPLNAGRAACPCNDLAHNHPEVEASEGWDQEANKERTPEIMPAAIWRQAAASRQPGGVASVGTAGEPMFAKEQLQHMECMPQVCS